MVQKYIEKITNGQSLSQEEAAVLFSALINGELGQVEIAALLIALKTKGETVDEISGAVTALRKNALVFNRPGYSFADSCGTGGDGAHTINVSTAAAFVAAAAGVPVAKHGNRSISSKCGSADVFENIGINLEASPEISRKCLDTAGICFFYAPMYHSGLRHAGSVRKELGMRTVMNILGPLVNPAAPDVQVMGVYDKSIINIAADVLKNVGVKTALVVNGSGLDEIAVHGMTRGALLRNGSIENIELSPSDAGLKEYSLDAIRGGTPGENTEALKNILSGCGSDAHNAAVAINAGALIWIYGSAKDLKDGASKALELMSKGTPMETALKLAECSHGS